MLQGSVDWWWAHNNWPTWEESVEYQTLKNNSSTTIERAKEARCQWETLHSSIGLEEKPCLGKRRQKERTEI